MRNLFLMRAGGRPGRNQVPDVVQVSGGSLSLSQSFKGLANDLTH